MLPLERSYACFGERGFRVVKECAENRGQPVRQDLLAFVTWAEGPALRPAQGIALGNWGDSVRLPAQRAKFGERLARWADATGSIGPILPGRCPGLGEPCPFGAITMSPMRVVAPGQPVCQPHDNIRMYILLAGLFQSQNFGPPLGAVAGIAWGGTARLRDARLTRLGRGVLVRVCG